MPEQHDKIRSLPLPAVAELLSSKRARAANSLAYVLFTTPRKMPPALATLLMAGGTVAVVTQTQGQYRLQQGRKANRRFQQSV